MIETRALQPQTNRDRLLAGCPVRVHVANVVDVKDSYRKQSAARRGQKQERIDGLCLDEVATQYAYPAKEDQNGQIAKADVTIRQSAGRIRYRSPNRRSANDSQHERQYKPIRAKGKPQQSHSRGDGQRGAENNRSPHFVSGNQPALHSALRSLAVATISSVHGVTIVIGEIGKDLQQNGGQQAEQGHKPVKGAARRRQGRAHNDARCSQGQRTRSHRVNPDRRAIGSRTYFSHFTLKV